MPPLLRTAPGGWGGLLFLVNEAPRPLGGCMELRVLGSPQASTHASFCLQIDLYAGALFVHICLGWNFYLSTIIMLAITALYTIAGAAPGDMQETGRLAGGGSGHLLP